MVLNLYVLSPDKNRVYINSTDVPFELLSLDKKTTYDNKYTIPLSYNYIDSDFIVQFEQHATVHHRKQQYNQEVQFSIKNKIEHKTKSDGPVQDWYDYQFSCTIA